MDDLVKRLREAARFHSSLKGRAIPTVNDGAMEREAADRIEALERENGDAYHQRNVLVAALSRIFPASVTRTKISGWDDDWHGCVYIMLPTGQISYHFHDDDGHLFRDLPPFTGTFDGHDRDMVHARLLSLSGTPAPDALQEDK